MDRYSCAAFKPATRPTPSRTPMNSWTTLFVRFRFMFRLHNRATAGYRITVARKKRARFPCHEKSATLHKSWQRCLRWSRWGERAETQRGAKARDQARRRAAPGDCGRGHGEDARHYGTHTAPAAIG